VHIAAVVVTWNGAPWIEACVDSLAAQDACPDLVVVDNGSDDNTVEIVEGFRSRFAGSGASFTVLQLESNIGFPKGANYGLREVLGRPDRVEAALLLNQDAILEPGCLQAFSNELRSNPRAGCLGAKNLYPKSRLIQHAGGFLNSSRMVGLHHGHNEPDGNGHHDTVREVQFVTGSSMLLRCAAIEEVGLFNEVFSPGYYEDVELCDRIRDHGWQVVFTPAASVLHHESSSFSDEMARIRLAHRNRLIYLLPQLADPEFERDFISAETDFLEHHATFEEKRAISGAALDLLVDLPRIIRRRLETSRIPAPLTGAANRVSVCLRTTCRSLLLPS